MPDHSRLPALLLPASLCATLLLAGCGAIPAPTAPVTVQGRRRARQRSWRPAACLQQPRPPARRQHRRLWHNQRPRHPSICSRPQPSPPTPSMGSPCPTSPRAPMAASPSQGITTCTAGQVVYALATGWQSWPHAVRRQRSNLSLIAVLGTCPASGTFLIAHPYLTINEVTTVAATYALSGYLTDDAHLQLRQHPSRSDRPAECRSQRRQHRRSKQRGSARYNARKQHRQHHWHRSNPDHQLPRQHPRKLRQLQRYWWPMQHFSSAWPPQTEPQPAQRLPIPRQRCSTSPTTPGQTPPLSTISAPDSPAFANALGGAPHDWTITISYSESSFRR